MIEFLAHVPSALFLAGLVLAIVVLGVRAFRAHPSAPPAHPRVRTVVVAAPACADRQCGAFRSPACGNGRCRSHCGLYCQCERAPRARRAPISQIRITSRGGVA